MTQSVKNIALSLVFCTLTACAGGKDWPNLSDPLPDPAERDRVRLEASPTVMSAPDTTTPTTPAEAAEILREVGDSLPQELKAYRQALTAYDESPDADARKDNWLDAQLKLTRLSRTLSRLDPFIETQDSTSEMHQAARELLAVYEPLVVEERQRLFRLNRQ